MDKTMKALALLKENKNEIEVLLNTYDIDEEDYDYDFTLLPDMLKQINEAIKELEDLQNRDCSGCKHLGCDYITFRKKCAKCGRKQYMTDYFKPKEQ